MCVCGAPQGKLDIDAACRGFVDLAKLAMAALVQQMFADAAFSALFHKLCGPEWLKGDITSSILLTLQDFFKDYEIGIEPSSYKRRGSSPPCVCSVLHMHVRGRA